MSKTLFRDQGYRFFFNDDETRMHVIAYSWDGEAKFWLDPEVELEHTDKFTRLELEDVRELIDKHLEQLRGLWAEHFPDRV
jgi:ribosomal protein L16/L10AE